MSNIPQATSPVNTDSYVNKNGHATVPLEVFQREREKRIAAEQERDHWKNEFYLSRNLRRAPVLRPVDKDVLEEFRHVQKWGTVEDKDGNKRANYKTIAKHLHISPDTVARSAERLEKLELAEIHEHQGPQDESERKYIQVREEKLHTIDKLEDPEQVVPKQGGNRYICPKCDSTDVAIRTVKTLHCNECHHEEVVEDEWKMQNGHKAQKQLAFQKSKHAQEQNTDTPLPEKQVGDHSVYTVDSSVPEPEKQVAFEELKALGQWICWRYGTKKNSKGKFDKKPFDAKLKGPLSSCDYTDPASWASYEQAQAKYEESQKWFNPYAGIGFCFKKGGGLVGIDQDGSLDPRIHSYAETSVSGTGIHIIAHGSIPKAVKRPEIELYDERRFFTWTGDHLDGTPETIEDCQAELDALYQELAPPEIVARYDYLQTPVQFTCSRSDEEILDKARNARNGVKFIALYGGDWSGYPSQSEADQALCRMLAYWCDNNVSTIDRLFRQSQLKREKWERDDYREQTISKAIGQNWQVAS